MKAKFVKVIKALCASMVIIVGCGQKEANVSQKNIAEEPVESEIAEEVQDNVEDNKKHQQVNLNLKNKMGKWF